MTEENVTKYLLKWLIKENWIIVCFDFPQSGTGHLLHQNDSGTEKNKGAICPDIVATKEGICIFFENKERFYRSDYEKQNILINSNNYSISINNLLSNYSIDKIYYGIGLPTIKYSKKAKEAEHLVDFIIGINADSSVSILYNPKSIRF